jgi:hemolysin activation/secretion protein
MTSLLRTGTLPALSALTLALLNSAAVAQTVPVAPDAGQTMRELQPQLALPVPQAVPPLRVEGAPAGANADDARFLVRSFQISGNAAIPTAGLQALLADLVGGQQSLVELNAAVARITAYYRERGYAVARAYLPAQEIKDGVVAINILEGRIDQRRLRNQSRLSDERVNAYLDQIKDGDVIRSAQVDRGLLLLNDMPGVGSARATLQPGASVGTSDLLVELNPAAPYAGNVSLDNYGNRFTGQYRLGGALYINSPLNIGDQLAFNGLTSDQDLTYARLAYQLPVGSDGLRMGAAYFETRYRLGKEFVALDAHGKATSGSVFAIYPFIRSQLSNLSGTFTWEQKRLTDRVDATATVTDKAVRLANLGLSASHQDTFGGGGISSLDLSAARGRLEIKSPGALAIDAASAQSNGAYTRLSYSAARLQRLSRSNLLSFALSGQRASKNLDSSEKFSLGGANGVRAYPQGEGIGDEGYLASLELRHDFTNALQGTLFYDTGSVTINRNPFGAAASNSRTLSGLGVGVNAALAAGVQIRASLAWRTGGGQPTSIPASAVRSPTLWVQARAVF